MQEHFGFVGRTICLSVNGVAEKYEEGVNDEGKLSPEEATSFRAVTARLNFLAQDCPKLQIPVT